MPLLALHRRFVLGNDKMATAPDLSLRGAKRRGALSAKREEVPLGCNLGKAVAISPMAFPRFSRILRDCHVGLRPPRNDKLGGLAAQNVLQSLPTCKALATRKGHAANGCAVSAAAEAIGAAVLTIARASCWRVAGQGMPCPYRVAPFIRGVPAHSPVPAL